MFDFLIVYAGTGATWVLSTMNDIISIFVGLGTLAWTAMKLIESYKGLRGKIEIEKIEAPDEGNQAN